MNIRVTNIHNATLVYIACCRQVCNERRQSLMFSCERALAQLRRIRQRTWFGDLPLTFWENDE